MVRSSLAFARLDEGVDDVGFDSWIVDEGEGEPTFAKIFERGCIGNDELAHGVEGIINADGHLNGYIGTEDG